jgi:ATP-dependent DNA helicase DinG
VRTPTSRAKRGEAPDIMSQFPKELHPRAGQVQTLAAIQSNWDKADVLAIDMPVGAGKSAVAVTIARWASKQGLRSLITSPTNLLVAQYLRDYPRLATLKGKDLYACHEGSELQPQTCKERAANVGACCKGGCPYTADNRKIRAVPYGVVNNWVYLAHRLYPDVLIADEAHQLLGMLRDLAAKKLWQHEYNYPKGIRSYSDLLDWVKEERQHREGDGRGPDQKLELLHKDLVSGTNRYLVEQSVEGYFGRLRPCLKLLPIDTRDVPPLLWPAGRVRKIILLSATLGAKDLEQLGLARRRSITIETPSPISPGRRPIRVHAPGFDVSHDSGPAELAALAAELARIAEAHAEERGVIHCTYELLRRLQPLLAAGPLGPRLVTHDRDSKAAQYQAWLDAGPTAVLLCAGLGEGIDLPGDLGRWQVITKVPWPNLGEPAWKWVADTDPDRYAWEALKAVMQASGRICRGPGDYGITFVLDRSFSQLPLEVAPSWFRGALQAGEDLG